MENWKASVEGERWKVQDKTYLSCKVDLKCAIVLLFWSSSLQGRDGRRRGRL